MSTFSFIDIKGKNYEYELNFNDYYKTWTFKKVSSVKKLNKFTTLLQSKVDIPIHVIVYEGTAINADNFDEYINKKKLDKESL